MNHERKRPIAIEDLLRLKRTERPPAEFWPEFDRDLRAKQLAALMVKRPWWQSLPRVFFGFSRYHLPIGAAAILTVTFVSLRDFQSVSPTQVDIPVGSRLGAVAPAAARTAIDSKVENQQTVSYAVSLAGVTAVAFSPVVSESAANAVPGYAASVEVSRLSLMLDGFDSEPARGDATSAPRNLVASIKVAQPVELATSRSLLGAATGFESRVIPARQTREPLQQITPPSERNRAKLLAAMVSMTSTEVPVRSSDRVANRLSEERLYDQIHRFGARGAGVSMKF